MKKQNSPQPNNLFMLRHIRGLELKQVASMLQQRSTSQLSSYESGAAVPGLRNYLKLMLIYDATPKDMLPGLIEACRSEIEESVRQRTFVLAYPDRVRVLDGVNSCSYADKLEPGISPEDRDLVLRHVRSLATGINRVA
jgi:transcriptional regulator with XRE-family HTH domain